MTDTTLQKSKIHEAADSLAREIQELALNTAATFGDFVEACRPDLTTAGVDDEAEIDRLLDAQREIREAIMRKLQPGLSRVLKEMFIAAANELPVPVPAIDASVM